MKFTDKIRKKIDNAKSETEVKAILAEIKGGAEEAGVMLTDDELDKVAGGAPLISWDPDTGKYILGNGSTKTVRVLIDPGKIKLF